MNPPVVTRPPLRWFGRTEAFQALSLFREDVLPDGAAPRYDAHGVRHRPLVTGGGDKVWHLRLSPCGTFGTRVNVPLRRRDEPELERLARRLILQAAQEQEALDPMDMLARFQAEDTLFASFIYIPDEAGVSHLIAVGDPDYLGVAVRKGGRSGLALLHPEHCIRVTTGAPPGHLPSYRLFNHLGTSRERYARFLVARRAKALLFRSLTREQKWELRGRGFVTVQSQDASTFRIYPRYGLNVRRVEDDVEVESLCVVPRLDTPIPVYDLMLAQKLMLQHQQEQFYSIANRHELRRAPIPHNPLI